MSGYVKLNVRCCCQPQKILGTLWVLEKIVARGAGKIPFHFVEKTSPIDWNASSPVVPIAITTEQIELRRFWSAPGKMELAVYSDDRPAEFWLKIPGFQPSEPQQFGLPDFPRELRS
jgi:hypothetical protein